MSFRGRVNSSALIIGTILVFAMTLPGPVQAGTEKGQTVDSGSFGIFLAGKRLATETFQIQQKPDFSTATSELKVDDGSNQSQRSELQITASGDLHRYEWHELSPGKARAVVEPNNEFLIEHLLPNPPGKPVDQSFVLPISTMVLDDYFFSHREILVWRYLAQNCTGGLKDCKLGRQQFGVLVPRQRISVAVTLEYTGREKVLIRGVERELNRINLQSDAGDWVLWIDENLKLVRILIAGENLEILRD